MIDMIVIGLVGISAIFGLFRGIVSQIVAILGLVVAWYFAPQGGKAISSFVEQQLGCSRFMAEKASIFFAGVAIYLVCWFLGLALDKLFLNRIIEFKKLNRIGGAVLGATKAGALVAFIFFFLTLIPAENIKAWVPKLLESRTYRLSARYNPAAKPLFLERMRYLRSSVRDPKKVIRLRESNEVGELLARHRLNNVFNDKQFMKSIESGDYEAFQNNEQMESLLQDDKLVELLGQLEKDAHHP